MYERLIRRVIYVAKCDCGWTDIIDLRPPREKQCPQCGTWCKYNKDEYIGKDIFGK